MPKSKTIPELFKVTLCFLVIHLVFLNLLFAQQGNTKEAPVPIKGTVLSAKNSEPLQGVFIKNNQNNRNVLSDKSGKFTIPAAIGDTLSFSYVGYTSTQWKLTSNKEIVIRLDQGTKGELDDVIVIGYGEVKKKDLTGSVSEVKMDDIIKAPVASFDQALAGRLAGVQVSSNEGQPGSEMNIVIRGGNSLTQSNSPLYVIDGFPIEDPNNASLNPNDIQSINILKDASATAIYGSRGANGVIIIETKKGKAGKSVIRYNGSFGFQQVSNTIQLMDSYEFVKYQLELNPLVNTPTYLTKPGRTLEDYKNIKAIDWQDKMFRTASMQSHNLSLSGGSGQTRYTISGSVFNQDGIILNSGYKRYQGRISVDQTVSKKLKVGANVNYTKDENYGQLSSSLQAVSVGYSTYQLYRTWGYRPVTGGAEIVDEFFDDDEGALGDARVNPVISTRNEVRKQGKKTFIGNASATYTIIPDLDLKVLGGINSRESKEEEFYNSKTGRGYPNVNNLKGVNGAYDNIEINDWVNENTLTYKKKLNRNHNIEALIGFTMQGRTYSRYGFDSQLIPNEEMELSGLDNGIAGALYSTQTQNTLASYLSRVTYNYKSRYLLTATFRADGSSKFASKNKWGYFPSAAFAWRISKENFMKQVRFVSDAKLRMSLGVTGNNRIGDDDIFSSLTMPYSAYYSLGNAQPAPGVAPARFGNKDLKWESTEQADIGIDLDFFNGRIGLVADLYQKITKDLLLNSNVPTSSGFSNIYKNVGKVRNQGIEFTLSSVNIKTKNLTWSSDFNISFNRNKVLALAEGEEQILSDVSWTSSYNDQFLYKAALGGSAASFMGYAWEGVYQYEDFDVQPNGSYLLKKSMYTNGTDRVTIQPGDVKYKDMNGDGAVDSKDIVEIGRGLPVHSGGFNNNIDYKGFNLNIFFQWSYGNDIFNANRIMFEGNSEIRNNLNQYASYADRWSPENPASKNYRAGGQGVRSIYPSRVIEDGSYLRLKTVALSYTIPSALLKRAKIGNLQVYASAQNLYTWTNYSGLDPEVSVRNSTLTPGFDYSAYPRARTITFGIKAEL